MARFRITFPILLCALTILNGCAAPKIDLGVPYRLNKRWAPRILENVAISVRVEDRRSKIDNLSSPLTFVAHTAEGKREIGVAEFVRQNIESELESMGIRMYTSTPLQLSCQITRYEVNWKSGLNVSMDAHFMMRVELVTSSERYYERILESAIQDRAWGGGGPAFEKAGPLYRRLLQHALDDLFSDISFQRALTQASTIKTSTPFGSEIYSSALDKSGSKKVTVKKGPVPADVDSSSKVEALHQVEKWGLVIGISKYKDTRIPALRYSTADAKAFYEWCISPDGGKYAPSRVKLLLDQEATGKNIRNALFVWLTQALEEDMVTIYFAGHGSPGSPDSSDNLFLLPHDAEYKDVATTGFPMWDIETALTRFIKAKKVVVIADACHSGGVGHAFDVALRANRAMDVNPISSGLQNLSQIGDGVCVISASDDKQFSQESKNWGGGHGVFTYFLLQGLKGEADYSKDGNVTLGELIPFLSEQVRRATKNAQNPTVAGKFDPALSIGK